MRLNSPKQQLTATYLEVPRSANLKEAAPKNSKRRHSHNLRGSRGATTTLTRTDQAVCNSFSIILVLYSATRDRFGIMTNSFRCKSLSFVKKTTLRFGISFSVEHLDIRDKT